MSAAIQTFKILLTRGPCAAIDATLNHPPVRRRIHELRASLLGENVVTLDGIDVDPTHDVFSDNMVDKSVRIAMRTPNVRFSLGTSISHSL